MAKYLDLLKKMKNCKWNQDYLPQLEKIEAYVKGEITSQELLEGIEKRGVIYWTINKLLNYEERDVRYYVHLPNDMYFNRSSGLCLLAGRIEDYEIADNSIDVIGPSYYKQKWPGVYERHWMEVTGDFSQYPEGVMLFEKDWYRIIAKYPNLYERMYNLTITDPDTSAKEEEITMEQVIANVDKQIARYANLPEGAETRRNGKEEAQYLPQEVIDSIKFIIPTEYLTKEQVLSGNFGTFEELAQGHKPVEEEQVEITQSDESTDYSENEDNFIRVGLGDLIEYINGQSRKYIAQGIDLDMEYITEKSVEGSTKKEIVLMLADFLLNYKGDESSNHLYWLASDPEIVNGRICDIPLMAFAKLNSPEIATQLAQFGAEDITTAQSENEDFLIGVAQVLGYGQERRISMSDTMSVINGILGTNAEQPFSNGNGSGQK